MIVIPPRKPSKEQRRKALNCLAYYNGEDSYIIWNPETDSRHVVTKGHCDCVGFSRFGYCYHITAVNLHKESISKLSAKKVIDELYDF